MSKVEAHSAGVTLLTQARLCVRVMDPNETRILKFRVLNKRSVRRTRSATSCDPGMKAMMMEKQWCNMGWRRVEQQKVMLCVAGDFPSQSL